MAVLVRPHSVHKPHAGPAPPPPAEDALTIRAESWHGREAAVLRAELEAELRLRYGQSRPPIPGAAAGPRPDSAPAGPVRSSSPDPIDPDPRVFLIAWDRNGQPLGCGAVGRLGHGTFQIKRMFVRPEARRRGVAQALLAALEARAVAGGARWIVLETGPLQPEAINLYVRAGYARIAVPGVRGAGRRSMCFGRVAPRPALP